MTKPFDKAIKKLEAWDKAERKGSEDIIRAIRRVQTAIRETIGPVKPTGGYNGKGK